MSVLQYLDTFLIYIYILEESEVVLRKSSIRKLFLQIPQIHKKAPVMESFFGIKLQQLH